LGSSFVTHTYQHELFLKAFGNASDHVVHQLTHGAAHGIGFTGFVDRNEGHLTVVIVHFDQQARSGGKRAASSFDTDLVKVNNDNGKMTFIPVNDSREANAMSGTMRQLVNNMVTGVTKGFEKKLNLVGVGYKAAAQGNKLNLAVGYSHPVNIDMPAGIKVETPAPTEIIIKGADRQRVGQIAAEIRAVRPPEPYKGKGIRYSDEKITIKETKKK